MSRLGFWSTRDGTSQRPELHNGEGHEERYEARVSRTVPWGSEGKFPRAAGPGGLVALATVLTAIGLSVEAIAGVDVFMDMGRTAVNVFGNTIAVKLVQHLGVIMPPASSSHRPICLVRRAPSQQRMWRRVL
jgi:hypothetical protein